MKVNRDRKGLEMSRDFQCHKCKALLALAIAVTLLFVGCNGGNGPTEFWASEKSNIYHYPSCKWAKKIRPYNLIIFNSPEEAIASGYRPCKVCRPPYPKSGRVHGHAFTYDRHKTAIGLKAFKRLLDMSSTVHGLVLAQPAWQLCLAFGATAGRGGPRT